VAPELLKNLWTLELHNEKLRCLYRTTGAAAIKEMLEINRYTQSGASRLVIGRTLLLSRKSISDCGLFR